MTLITIISAVADPIQVHFLPGCRRQLHQTFGVTFETAKQIKLAFLINDGVDQERIKLYFSA